MDALFNSTPVRSEGFFARLEFQYQLAGRKNGRIETFVLECQLGPSLRALNGFLVIFNRKKVTDLFY
jgi:hypothetical protein